MKFCERARPAGIVTAARLPLDYRKSTLAKGSRWDYKPPPKMVGVYSPTLSRIDSRKYQLVL